MIKRIALCLPFVFMITGYNSGQPGDMAIQRADLDNNTKKNYSSAISAGTNFSQEKPAIPFNGKIYISSIPKEAMESVEDLKDILSKHTKHQFEIIEGEGDSGIQFINDDLKGRTGQGFHLSKSGLKKAVITYTVGTSLINGIYTFLDLLGFRWYGVGERWEYSPGELNEQNINKYFEPTFRNRYIGPSGGVNYAPPYDKTISFKKDWDIWFRRNRFTEDHRDAGHVGQAFYQQNKKESDAHPEWFCSEVGKTLGRIKIDNAKAVSFFKKWALAKKDPNKSFNAIGADPADGAGREGQDCLPGKMNIKNYSDKWFWLANEIAKEIPDKDNNTVVTMYAYGSFVGAGMVPGFSLDKNLYPILIPYAFQTTYRPEEMIIKWSKKVSGNMGMYDYWNITQWSRGLPQMNIYTLPAKLKLWRDNRINGIGIESTYSKGAMMHSHWLAGKLMWNADEDFEKLYTEFLTNCFGKGAPHIRKMYDRWSLNDQRSGEVPLSLLNLKDAANAVEKGSVYWDRVIDLKAFVHYMRLWYENDKELTLETFNRLCQYMDMTHELRIVQTAALRTQGNTVTGHYVQRPKNYIQPTPYATPHNNFMITKAEVEKQFLKDLVECPKPYDVPNMKFDIDKASVLPEKPEGGFKYGYGVRFFFKPKKNQKLTFKVGVRVKDTRFFVGEGERPIIDEEVKENSDLKQYYSFTANFEAGKEYQVIAGGYERNVRIKFPGECLFFKDSKLTDHITGYPGVVMPYYYFYVPKNTTEIVFSDFNPEGLNSGGYMVQPDGVRLHRQSVGVKNIYKVPVDKKFRGKIWKAEFGHAGFYLMNIPHVLSLTPFRYDEP